jgi:hypothetical protein
MRTSFIIWIIPLLPIVAYFFLTHNDRGISPIWNRGNPVCGMGGRWGKMGYKSPNFLVIMLLVTLRDKSERVDKEESTSAAPIKKCFSLKHQVALHPNAVYTTISTQVYVSYSVECRSKSLPAKEEET